MSVRPADPRALPAPPTDACPPWRRLGRVLLSALAALLCGLALAPAGAGTLPGELPALVGRLSAVQGDVRWLDRDSGQWTGSTAAQPLHNWPVAAGDRLRTGADARAELRIGSTTVRLGADAELWLQRLDDQALALHLESGTIALRLPAIDGDAFGPVQITTREGRWLPLRPGSYRLDREPDATQATAWQGELRFEGRDSAWVVPAGRRADLWLDRPDSATPGRTRYAWAEVDRDAFADWVAREERLDDAPVTARHVSPGVTGWQDLDRHGDWVTDPELGSLWQPRVLAPGWAPYQAGRWAWVAPWGWTWIDAAPWGFAPFHYGTWVVFGGRWSWSPGPRTYRPHYAPVLGGWVQGPVVGIGVQIGGVRPPPPRVVMPVVVPVVVHRPGRPVVVVNTPLIRPGHGPAPWPYRDGVSRGGDRPPVPGYGQHREPEPRRSEPLPRPRHEFDARQFDRRPVEPRETDRRNGRPGDSAPGFERRGPYGGTPPGATVVTTPPRAPVTAPPAAAAPAVAITPQPARTAPTTQPVATVPGSAAPPRPAAPVAAPPAPDAAAVTPAPAQPDRRDARRTYGEGGGPYGRKPTMQQP